MDETTRILEFISYCIEMCAARDHVSGQDVYSRFKKFGVIDYLGRNYEPLHTQGFGYILPTIDRYIAEQEAK